MSTLQQVGRVLQTWFGITLVAALALVSGCAAEDVAGASGQPDEASLGEAAEAQRPVAGVKLGCLYWGDESTLEVYFSSNGPPHCLLLNYRTPGSSLMYCLGEPPFRVCPECMDLSNSLDCRR